VQRRTLTFALHIYRQTESHSTSCECIAKCNNFLQQLVILQSNSPTTSCLLASFHSRVSFNATSYSDELSDSKLVLHFHCHALSAYLVAPGRPPGRGICVYSVLCIN